MFLGGKVDEYSIARAIRIQRQIGFSSRIMKSSLACGDALLASCGQADIRDHADWTFLTKV